MEIVFDRADMLARLLFGNCTVISTRQPEYLKVVSDKLRTYLDSLPDSGDGLFIIINNFYAAEYARKENIISAYEWAKEKGI